MRSTSDYETGLGQFIDVSMADCLLSLIFDEPFECYDELGLIIAKETGSLGSLPSIPIERVDGAVAIGAGTLQRLDETATYHGS